MPETCGDRAVEGLSQQLVGHEVAELCRWETMHKKQCKCTLTLAERAQWQHLWQQQLQSALTTSFVTTHGKHATSERHMLLCRMSEQASLVTWTDLLHKSKQCFVFLMDICYCLRQATQTSAAALDVTWSQVLYDEGLNRAPVMHQVELYLPFCDKLGAWRSDVIQSRRSCPR